MEYEYGLKPIEKSVLINTTPEEAWADWTDSNRIVKFFSPVATIDLRIGGAYELIFLVDGEVGQRGSEDCVVLSYLPTRMLSFSWSAPPQFPNVRKERTWVVLEFERAAGQTRMTLTHLGWQPGDEWSQVHDYFDAAWGRVLAAHQRLYAK